MSGSRIVGSSLGRLVEAFILLLSFDYNAYGVSAQDGRRTSLHRASGHPCIGANRYHRWITQGKAASRPYNLCNLRNLWFSRLARSLLGRFVKAFIPPPSFDSAPCGRSACIKGEGRVRRLR